jgi:hypothetical protein
MSGTENRIKQLKKYFFLIIKDYLTKNFSENKGKILNEKFQKLFNELYSQNEDLMPDPISKEHGINPIFIIALYRTLNEQKISLNDFKDIIISIYEIILAEMLKLMVSQLEKSKNPFSMFVNFSLPAAKRLYGNEHFRQEILQADDEGYFFDINKCLYFEIFQKNGLPELGPILCDYDLILARAVTKWIKFERNKTIANGSTLFIFRYYPI